MAVERTIFIVSRPGQFIENVIVAAVDDSFARSHASHILGGEPDHYVVDIITKHPSRTVFLLDVS